jgi:hypothetical protein
MDEPPTPPEPSPGPGGGPGAEAPSEEELRERIEEGLRKVRVQDVLLESVVTIINLTARRIGKEDERDLDQAKVGIDAVRALVELLEPEPQAQVKNALSELQMLYAQHARGGGAAPEGGEGGEPPSPGGASEPGQERREGEPPPGLWVPPGSS